MPDNHLFYGDNLDILRRYVKDESVDLVYLDPPFNSKADYNILFPEHDGTRSAAQVKAFEDTWIWEFAAPTYYDTVDHGPEKVSQALQAFRLLLGTGDMLAYLSMMAPRLVELRRALKATGSLYLHCDPTASHYLKVLLDAVFGARMYRAEIVWKRSSAHSDTKQGRAIHGHIHDTLLFYTKGETWTWNPLYTTYTKEYIDAFYRHVEPETGRRYRLGDLTAAKPGGDTDYEWKGARPYKGRYWAYSRANMERFEAEGRLVYTKSGRPNYKRYLDEMPGVPLQDMWTDIKPLGASADERMDYATQKPLALLERILQTSSNPGDVVLDPFCGCGTAIAAAYKLGRQWIGIDVTQLAITAIKNRLAGFGDLAAKSYRVIGEPTTESEAKALAAQDRYQFQYWALGLVGARPTEEKKGADKGIDGRLYFHDEAGPAKQVILQVKSGDMDSGVVRDLVGTMQREKATMGVLISLQAHTAPMRREAADAGMYTSPWNGKAYQRVQLLTVAELLEGKQIEIAALRQVNITYQRGQRTARDKGLAQGSWLDAAAAEEG